MQSVFGHTTKNEVVNSIIISNTKGMHVTVLTLGAAIQSILVKDKHGNYEDVVLGFESVSDYESDRAYIGVAVGRVAGRITNACFTTKNNDDVHVSKNHGDCCLHGGAKGISKSVWSISDMKKNEVTLNITSFEADDGFPGDVHISLTYTVLDDNSLVLNYQVDTSSPCPINLTNHSYFNLGGVNKSDNIYDHVVQILAKKTLQLNSNLMPSGDVIELNDLNDFQMPKQLSRDLLSLCPGDPKGFDGYYIFDSIDESASELKAKVVHPPSGRVLELFTNQAGVQFYTSNFLDGSKGKNNRVYNQHAALCLEAHNYPDAMNHDNFPDIFVEPEKPYRQVTMYRFLTQ